MVVLENRSTRSDGRFSIPLIQNPNGAPNKLFNVICSKRNTVFPTVRGPIGPHGATAESPERDGITKRGPFSSGKSHDGHHC